MKSSFSILVSFLLLSSTLNAADYTAQCLVKSDTANPNFIGERSLSIKYRIAGTHSYIDGVTLGGSKPQELYGPSNRGGYEIGFCQLNENEFLEPIEKFNVYSDCTARSPRSRAFVST